ncbi:MAG: DNA-binding NarL/FixJ family response regulator, partial [Myxococcota bacterium]
MLVLVSTDAAVRDRFVEGTESLAVLVPCQSADEAFDVMARHPAAVVLLDGQQSNIAPWQFAERLRAEHPGVDLALLAGDEYGDEEEDLREGWLAGVVPRNSAKRTLRAAVRRLIQSHTQNRENEALQGSVRVLEQCRGLMSCLEPGRVYSVALDIVLELLNRNQAIAVFQRESVPMSDAVVFRGLGE